MREIIFKGKNKRTGKWVEGNLIIKEKEARNLVSISGIRPIIETKYFIQYKNKKGNYASCEVCENTVFEYTGIDDKYKTKIFEGDTVYVEFKDEFAAIEWDDYTARFIIQFDNWISDFDEFCGRELEVLEDKE